MSAFSIAGFDNTSLVTMARRCVSETLAMASWSWALVQFDWVAPVDFDFEEAGICAKIVRVAADVGQLRKNGCRVEPFWTVFAKTFKVNVEGKR